MKMRLPARAIDGEGVETTKPDHRTLLIQQNFNGTFTPSVQPFS
jgi:hypothetical protein